MRLIRRSSGAIQALGLQVGMHIGLGVERLQLASFAQKECERTCRSPAKKIIEINILIPSHQHHDCKRSIRDILTLHKTASGQDGVSLGNRNQPFLAKLRTRSVGSISAGPLRAEQRSRAEQSRAEPEGGNSGPCYQFVLLRCTPRSFRSCLSKHTSKC